METSRITEKTLIQILDYLRTAIYIINNKGELIYFNKAAAEMDNLNDNDMGKHLADIYHKTAFQEHMDSPCLSTLKDGISHVNKNLEWFLADGTRVNAVTSTYPIKEKGEIKKVFALSENVEGLRKYLIEQGAYKKSHFYRLRNKSMKNGTQYVFNDIIGKSKALDHAVMMARRFASKSLPVMIYGETGTGKEMFAQSIHNAGKSVAGPFIPINCAAIPENLLESMLFGTTKGAFTGAVDGSGLFEKAENGSIFLDEINSMPITLQAKILRAIQEKEVQRIGDCRARKINCRIISATNKRITDAVADGELREDLFYRLSTGMVWVPSLKERREDINSLVAFFIHKTNEEINGTILTFSQELKRLFQTYDWPGNIRELSNTIESAMNMTEEGDTVLDVHHLPPYLEKRFCSQPMNRSTAEEIFSAVDDNQKNAPLSIDFYSDINTMTNDFERSLIEEALKTAKGNLTHCGKQLGISRQSLTVKVKKHNIDTCKFKLKKTDL